MAYLSLKHADQTVKVDHTSLSGGNIKRTIVWDKNASDSKVMESKSYEDVLRRRKERFGEVSPPRPKCPKASGQVTDIKTISVNDLNTLKKRSERFGESVSTLMKRSSDETPELGKLKKMIDEKDKMRKRLARFSNRVVNSSPTSSDKQLNVEVFRNARSATPELFQTIDQIDAEERGKIKSQEN